MPKTWRLPSVLVLLALANCAAPGGIYKGYEGPPQNVSAIAVLEWSSHRDCWVAHINGKYLHEGQPFFGGVATTIAHLLPGLHSVTVHNNFTGYLESSRDVTLSPRLEAGHSYVVRVEPCNSCDPFSVDFMIVEPASGAIIAKSTRFGSETLKEARAREVRACEQKCERDSSWKFSSCSYPYDDDKRAECREEIRHCKARCDVGLFEMIGDVIELFD